MTITSTDHPQQCLTWTPEQASSVLGIGVKATLALVRSGKLHAVRVGRRWLIPRDALVNFLADTAA